MLLVAKAPIHGLLLTLFIQVVISSKNNSAELSQNNELILGAKCGSVWVLKLHRLYNLPTYKTYFMHLTN